MSAPHFNSLTPAEAERLAMLAEECAEVIQVIGKTLRHGYDSVNPNDPARRTNRQLIEAEMADIMTIFYMMHDDGLHGPTIADLDRIWERKLRFTHHQIGGAS